MRIKSIVKRERARQGQVWMETMLYTLVALGIISAVIAFAAPKIREAQEKAVIERGLDRLRTMDALILEVGTLPTDNARTLTLDIPRGMLVIDGVKEEIVLSIPEVRKPYSEVGIVVQDGRVQVLTTKTDKTHTITLTISYQAQNINVTSNAKERVQELTQAPTPYTLVIRNQASIQVVMEGATTKVKKVPFINIEVKKTSATAA